MLRLPPKNLVELAFSPHFDVTCALSGRSPSVVVCSVAARRVVFLASAPAQACGVALLATKAHQTLLSYPSDLVTADFLTTPSSILVSPSPAAAHFSHSCFPSRSGQKMCHLVGTVDFLSFPYFGREVLLSARDGTLGARSPAGVPVRVPWETASGRADPAATCSFLRVCTPWRGDVRVD